MTNLQQHCLLQVGWVLEPKLFLCFQRACWPAEEKLQSHRDGFFKAQRWDPWFPEQGFLGVPRLDKAESAWGRRGRRGPKQPHAWDWKKDKLGLFGSRKDSHWYGFVPFAKINFHNLKQATVPNLSRLLAAAQVILKCCRSAWSWSRSTSPTPPCQARSLKNVLVSTHEFTVVKLTRKTDEYSASIQLFGPFNSQPLVFPYAAQVRSPLYQSGQALRL